eukprot:CAMPEP_0194763040 /NCGR_PEP_ID=MMETSP0323_2-20130528/17800_1 /TAXON_ID=2866 ORGANISM="Crypthecodinium cohnii, Strain Seligo" /NCGR_SAMPLE_ID=MMETSP0323_2 /ASSEMBLY_ACC=CAM_ASM_000346 /LENGTH=35 /DNA_ID= /DNA_START= /DNA_END= /DNA_ORIENTATION=
MKVADIGRLWVLTVAPLDADQEGSQEPIQSTQVQT